MDIGTHSNQNGHRYSFKIGMDIGTHSLQNGHRYSIENIIQLNCQKTDIGTRLKISYNYTVRKQMGCHNPSIGLNLSYTKTEFYDKRGGGVPQHCTKLIHISFTQKRGAEYIESSDHSVVTGQGGSNIS
jgi:hypothetical protein